ncbi:hypothetical protein DU478_18200 [Thalassococcus profundi]|uniref:DUF998 domain-containing protein n=1 Tax=Thalassococcus profundi TaxID=2282382 RepID=A0A369TL86_9RHOB|nr:hypothetical protein [Thalassococcus profundi]RDD64877.1 hypothetical protein DU478_18200 [Thalassococcus profundi]
MAQPPRPSRDRPRLDDLPFTVSLRRVNLGVGLAAFSLPILVAGTGLFLQTCEQNWFLDSISHYFYAPLSGSLFIATLSVIGVLLAFFFNVPDGSGRELAVNQVEEYANFKWWEIWLTRFAGIAAFLIAFVPTARSGCVLQNDVMRAYLLIGDTPFYTDGGIETLEQAQVAFDFIAVTGWQVPFGLDLHAVGAAVMFATLGYFALFVFTRDQTRDHADTPGSAAADPERIRRKRLRNLIYRCCGVTIFAAILAIGGKFALCQGLGPCAIDDWNPTFIVETLALWAFALAWLVKGRFFPSLADPGPPGQV